MNDTAKPNRPRETAELIEELNTFEGSDALGNGDFTVCHSAAARLTELEATLSRSTSNAVTLALKSENQMDQIKELEAERDRLKTAAVNWTSLEIIEAEEAGRQKATAEIVAWLRELNATEDDHTYWFYIAKRIERGDHLTTGKADG